MGTVYANGVPGYFILLSPGYLIPIYFSSGSQSIIFTGKAPLLFYCTMPLPGTLFPFTKSCLWGKRVRIKESAIPAAFKYRIAAAASFLYDKNRE